MRRRLIPVFLLLAFLTQGFLCSSNPTRTAWPQYVQAIDGLLGDYDGAMAEVANIDIALSPTQAPGPDGKKGEPAIKADEAVTQLEKNVIPKLDAIADRAAKLKVPGSVTITRMHAPLAEAMASRAEAYKLITKAYRTRDTDMFDKGIVKLTEASEKLGGFLKEYRDAKMGGGPRE